MPRRMLMSGSLILLLWMTIPAQAFTDLGHLFPGDALCRCA